MVYFCMLAGVLAGSLTWGNHLPPRQGHASSVATPPVRVVASSVPPAEPQAGQPVSSYGLTRRDFAAARELLLGKVEHLVPVREVTREAIFGDKSYAVSLTGTTPEFLAAHGLRVERGRFLTDADQQQQRNIAVLGSKVAKRLFPFSDPIGKSVRVGKDYFLVVGVLEPLPESVDRADRNERFILVPLSTMQTREGDLEVRQQAGQFRMERFELSRIEAVPTDPLQAKDLAQALTRLLASLHEDKSYNVETVGEEQDPKPGDSDDDHTNP